jgi:hypothetical protein
MQLLTPATPATPAATSSSDGSYAATTNAATKSKLSYRKHLLAKQTTKANKSGNQSALMPRSIAKKQLDATSPTTVNPLI